MGYDIAINKAWQDLAKFNAGNKFSIKFLGDEYDIDLKARRVLSLSCNVPAKDFTGILILHYIAQKIKGLPAASGEWLTFRELAGIEGYYPAFKKRAIEPIIRKYGKNPQGILQALDRLAARKVDGQDIAISIDALEGVAVLIKLFSADEEFGPDANMFFDRSITGIFCTEDIVVLAGLVASAL